MAWLAFALRVLKRKEGGGNTEERATTANATSLLLPCSDVCCLLLRYGRVQHR